MPDDKTLLQINLDAELTAKWRKAFHMQAIEGKLTNSLFLGMLLDAWEQRDEAE